MTSFEKSVTWFFLWGLFIATIYGLYIYDKHLERADSCLTQTVAVSGVLL